MPCARAHAAGQGRTRHVIAADARCARCASRCRTHEAGEGHAPGQGSAGRRRHPERGELLWRSLYELWHATALAPWPCKNLPSSIPSSAFLLRACRCTRARARACLFSQSLRLAAGMAATNCSITALSSPRSRAWRAPDEMRRERATAAALRQAGSLLAGAGAGATGGRAAAAAGAAGGSAGCCTSHPSNSSNPRQYWQLLVQALRYRMTRAVWYGA